MTDAPELWWSPSLAEQAGGSDVGGILFPGLPGGTTCCVYRDGWEIVERPVDAVPLVPAEPVDEKGRGDSYWRGHADGRMAERAHVDAQSVKRARPASLSGYAGSGDAASMGDAPQLPSGALYDGPPFAPELANAPIVTGESGAPAPLVVDQPVHDSTLPAELRGGLNAEIEIEDFTPIEPDVPGYDDDNQADSHQAAPPAGMAAAEFDGGPLHEAELYVKLVDGDLPTVVVTDAGDSWVAYTLTSPSPGGSLWRYRYAGAAFDAERRQCVYVDDNDRAESESQ